jgi:carboxypeptidase PM20D1
MRRPIRIIRNLLLLVIAAIVILTGVLLFNVLTHGSRQVEVTAVGIDEWPGVACAVRTSVT